MAELDLIPPYDTKASAAGRRGANATRTKKQGPCNAAATRQPAVHSVASPIKGLFIFLSPCIFLAWFAGDVNQSPTRYRTCRHPPAVGPHTPNSARDSRITCFPMKRFEGGASRCWSTAVCCRSRCGGDVNHCREHRHPGRIESRLELEVVASNSRRSLWLPSSMRIPKIAGELFPQTKLPA